MTPLNGPSLQAMLVAISDNEFGPGDRLADTAATRRAELLDQAARCRRLASGCYDGRTNKVLSDMADEYEAQAEVLRPH